MIALDAGDGRQAANDEAFIRQLTERRLHGLAENYCRDMRQRETVADTRAMWQLRLARISERHAWFTDSASRQELLNQCIAELIQFPRDNAVSPETELQLRFQQAGIIRTSIRIALLLNEAGHLFARGREAATKGLANPTKLDPDYAENIDQAIELIEKSLQQLENIRSQIDPLVARDLRESARLLLAELHLLRSQSAISLDAQTAAQDHNKAVELLKLILRSVQNPNTKYKTQWLQTELLLMSDSSAEFESQTRVLKVARPRTDDSPPELLSVRRLLSTQETQQSLRLLSDTSMATVMQKQQKEWLTMECLLGLRQLAEQLQDEKLTAEATDRFREANQRARASTEGVFREAVNCVNRRFELVNSVGVAVADLIEQVDIKRAEGRSQEALQLIDLSLQRLPPGGAQLSRAALKLHAGELLIDMKQWKAAHTRLTESAGLFKSSGRKSEQATADLLSIFCFAQMLSAGDRQLSKAAYTSSLQHHIAEFATESTLPTAQEWLLQIIQIDKPLEAVDLLFSMLTHENNSIQKVRLLEQIGRLLTSTASPQASKSHIDAFRESARQLAKTGGLPEGMSAVTDCYMLTLDTQPGQRPDWNVVLQRLTDILIELKSRSAGDASVSEAMLQCHLLEALASARLRRDPVILQRLRDTLMSLSREQAVIAADYFFLRYNGQELQTGDQWLAQVSDSLLRKLIAEKDSLDMQIHWLRVSARNAALTGNSDVQNQVIDQISRRKLTPAQLNRVAAAMSRQSAHSNATTTESSAAQTDFWRQVLTASEQGTDTWLEASIRLASISAAAGETDAAKRQLGVIMALYPEWGSPDRLKRAHELLQTLSP